MKYETTPNNMFIIFKANKLPEMVTRGRVNLNKTIPHSNEGLALMKLLIEYTHMNWGVIQVSDETRSNHIGYSIQTYIEQSGYLVRGLFNISSIPLEGYERDSEFQSWKAKVQEKGRLASCNENDINKSSITHMLCRLVGLTVNFILKMKDFGHSISVQQILGSELAYFFRYNFMTYSVTENHYDFLKNRLPSYCDLPPNRGCTIFQVPCVHRDIIIKKKSSYEIKPYRGI